MPDLPTLPLRVKSVPYRYFVGLVILFCMMLVVQLAVVFGDLLMDLSPSSLAGSAIAVVVGAVIQWRARDIEAPFRVAPSLARLDRHINAAIWWLMVVLVLLFCSLLSVAIDSWVSMMAWMVCLPLLHSLCALVALMLPARPPSLCRSPGRSVKIRGLKPRLIPVPVRVR